MSNEHVNSTFRSILDTICPPVERETRPVAEAIAPVATMGQPVKPPAPVTVEVSDDQNTVTVTTRFEFVQNTGLSYSSCCAKDDCFCHTLPCGLAPNFRNDSKKGYFREVVG